MTVQPADPIQRVVLDAGKSAKEALQMHDIPVIGDRIKIDSNDPQIVIYAKKFAHEAKRLSLPAPRGA